MIHDKYKKINAFNVKSQNDQYNFRILSEKKGQGDSKSYLKIDKITVNFLFYCMILLINRTAQRVNY